MRGYDGKDAIIESSGDGRGRRERDRSGNVPDGMHRIDNKRLRAGYRRRQQRDHGQGRHMRFGGCRDSGAARRLRLKLKTMNGGKILVENIRARSTRKT